MQAATNCIFCLHDGRLAIQITRVLHNTCTCTQEEDSAMVLRAKTDEEPSGDSAVKMLIEKVEDGLKVSHIC